jgi:alkylation response protein AidB-like acyl-CoA dehydrogenase
VNLEPSESQNEIAAVAGSFLAKTLPTSRLRELASAPDAEAIDEHTWRTCAELGWLALGLDEQAGGLGLGLAEEAMLSRELGRHLAPGPFRSTVLAAHLASWTGNLELSAAIASGQHRVGMITAEVALDVRPGDLALRFGESSAELLEVTSVERVTGVDPGTRFARIETGQQVAATSGARLLDWARVLIAAELLGIIEAVRDMSSEYARTRTQFGKPIGGFQAVKHRCADMAVAAYSIIGQVFMAALLVQADTPDATFQASAAHLLAVEGASRSTADNIQNHGGIGFTWEHDAHLFLKRSFLLEHLIGGRAASRRALLEASHQFR